MKFVTLVYSSSLLQCANHHGIGKGGLHEVHEPPKSWKSGKFAVFPLPSATVCTELNEIWYVYKRRRFALTWHIWPSSVKRWMWAKKTQKIFTKFWNIKESQPVQPLTLLGQMVSSIYLTAAAWNSSLLKIRQQVCSFTRNFTFLRYLGVDRVAHSYLRIFPTWRCQQLLECMILPAKMNMLYARYQSY